MRRPPRIPSSSLRAGAAAALVLGLLLVACAAAEEAAPAAASEPRSPAPVAAEEPAAGPLGPGYVVWESNRGGAWRIWIRDLDPDSTPRQLTPEEPGRVHCCPHLSPDGQRMAYLSLPPGGESYLPGSDSGPLHLLDLTSGQDVVLAPEARTYFENRAVVWRGNAELIYIAGDGRTMLLDLVGGFTRALTEQHLEAHGWLINSRLDFATRGHTSFSPYREPGRAVAERSPLGGCQPYFSADSRWGFWVAGAGGPINRIDLASGAVSTIWRKNDPGAADGFGYAYFPMFSADGGAFVYAASRGEHSHVEADYEIFVVAADPAGLEAVGAARRLTRHPATDRFPDVHLAPQPLGSHDGEAPLEVELEAARAGDWSWSFGDGATGRGRVGRHLYAEPGLYRVEARSDGETLAGTVRVRPARPPEVKAVTVTDGGREVRISFDEEVAAEAAVFAFDSGLEPVSWSLAEDRRSLRLRLPRALERVERFELRGVSDRAQRPNPLAPVVLEAAPPLWPARDDAIFLWRTGDSPNLFFDPLVGIDRAGILEPKGRAFLDRHHRMVVDGGAFIAGDEESNRLRWALQATNEMSLELTVEPAAAAAGDRALAVFGRRGQAHNFALLARGDELFFSMRISPHGPDYYAATSLGRLAPGRRHLVVSYTPGWLTLDVDGERVVETAAIQGDFFHWRSQVLAFGDQAGGGLPWRGAIEGVALYDRALSAAEAAASFDRYQRLLARREAVPDLVVEARLVRRSPSPTLAEIRPYREALAVHEYEVERVVAGAAPEGPLLVAHWELLDGERQPAAARREGERTTLRLEPFAQQPQLASVFLSNRFEAPPAFFAADGY